MNRKDQIKNMNEIKKDKGVKSQEIQLMKQWINAHMLDKEGNQPFSFNYDKQSSEKFLNEWPSEYKSKALDMLRIQHQIVWLDSKSGLEVRCISIEYLDFPIVEWTVYFKNTGKLATPIIENIQGLDFYIEKDDSSEFVLHGNYGDVFDYENIMAESYKPYELLLEPEFKKDFAPIGGRPTNGPEGWPYYNLVIPGGGIILAVGWPGQWSTSFKRDIGNGLQIKAGQQKTHLSLAVGEEIRSPLIALMFWKGADIIESQNLWRRWMLSYNTPCINKQVPTPIMSVSPAKELGLLDDSSCWNAIDTMDETGANVLWVDAGWYPCDPGKKLKFLWWGTGDWFPDPVRFPNGFKSLSEALHNKGRKLLLWFEPERIGDPDCWVIKNHPEWILDKVLLDLGNAEARLWITDEIDQLIKGQGIDIYRQDFNVFPGPLEYWRQKDCLDRQGMTENLYIQGYLTFWDELLIKHPHLLIDSCASGGRRNDLETLRRSVPLYRTDNYEKGPTTAVASQGHTFGFSTWVPFYGSGGHVNNIFTMRSYFMPSYQVWSPEANLATQARTEWAKVAPMMLGDFYPQSAWSLQDDQWIAWQFNLPEEGTGILQAFRRNKCEESTKRFYFRGIDSSAVYELTNFDIEGTIKVSGAELMSKGLVVRISSQPGSVIITYKSIG